MDGKERVVSIEKEAGFWKWYVRRIRSCLSLKWVSSTYAEYVVGVVTIIAAVTSASVVSPWCLFLVLAGVTIVAHAAWRDQWKI